MTSFDVETVETAVFEFSDGFLFTTCFDEEPLFNQFKQYYHSDKYMSQIPEDEFEQVRQILEKFFYNLVIEGSWEDYCVATDKKQIQEAY